MATLTATETQIITDQYVLYNGDAIEVMAQLPMHTVDFALYSPPFAGLFLYSSDPRDLSNCLDRDEFLTHYAFVVEALVRVMKPGRLVAVHCTDIPLGNTGHNDTLYDFPGDLIRLHQQQGMGFIARYHVWKEPLTIRNRTMAKGLMHKTLVEDATECSIAHADQALIFRTAGTNAVPVQHPHGLSEYLGAKPVPRDLLQYRNWQGDQIENKYSQWVWQQYASAFWDDVRLDRVLPYKAARESDDERHIHPLQLDVIERLITLWTNPGEVVFTPFMGVGSEVYGAVRLGRKGLGVELKPSYFRQAVANCREAIADQAPRDQLSLLDSLD